MGLGILGINKVYIVCGNALYSRFGSEFKYNLINSFLLLVCSFGKSTRLNGVKHYLKVKVVAKYLLKLVNNFLRFSFVSFYDSLRYFAPKACRRHNYSLAILA